MSRNRTQHLVGRIVELESRLREELATIATAADQVQPGGPRQTIADAANRAAAYERERIRIDEIIEQTRRLETAPTSPSQIARACRVLLPIMRQNFKKYALEYLSGGLTDEASDHSDQMAAIQFVIDTLTNIEAAAEHEAKT